MVFWLNQTWETNKQQNRLCVAISCLSFENNNKKKKEEENNKITFQLNSQFGWPIESITLCVCVWLITNLLGITVPDIHFVPIVESIVSCTTQNTVRHDTKSKIRYLKSTSIVHVRLGGEFAMLKDRVDTIRWWIMQTSSVGSVVCPINSSIIYQSTNKRSNCAIRWKYALHSQHNRIVLQIVSAGNGFADQLIVSTYSNRQRVGRFFHLEIWSNEKYYRPNDKKAITVNLIKQLNLHSTSTMQANVLCFGQITLRQSRTT